jgi:hypothetical protein
MSIRTAALAAAAFLALSALTAPALSTGTGEEGGAPSGGEPSSTLPASRFPPARSATGIALWHPDRILEAGAPLNAVAAGDFAPDRPGNETAAADASGKLWLAWRENHTWQSRVAWTAGGNLTSLARGDLEAGSAGSEIACGAAFANGSGAVFVVSGLGGQAAGRQILAASAEILAVAAGDLMPGVAGTELLAIDGGGNVSVAFPDSPSGNPKTIIRIAGAASLVVADLDPSRAGDEAAVGTSSGEVFELFWDGSAWQERGLWVSSSGISCLAFGDADPLHDGPELAMAAGSGEITLLERLGDTWSGRSAGNPGGPVSALAIGDADADLSGNELLAGLPDNVTRLRWDGSAWARERLWAGSGAVNGLQVAEVDADHAGLEVLAAGRGGPLTALGLYHPGFAMDGGGARISLSGGEAASFLLRFTPFDKLGGNLTISVGSLPAGVAVASGAGRLVLAPPNVSAALNLSVNASVPNGEHRFLVTASHQSGMFDTAWLSLALDRRLEFEAAVAIRDPDVQPGSSAKYTVTVKNRGTVNDSYRLEARVEGGWAVRFPDGNLTGTVAPGESLNLSLRVSVPADAAGRTAKLTVNASSLAQANLTRSASMKVVVPQKSALCGLVILPAGLVGTAFMLGRKGK